MQAGYRLLPQCRELAVVEGGAYSADDLKITVDDSTHTPDSIAREVDARCLHDVILSHTGWSSVNNLLARLRGKNRRTGSERGFGKRRSRNGRGWRFNPV